MSEQIGWRGFIDGMKREGANWAKILPQLPRLLHDHLMPHDEQIKADQKVVRDLRRMLRRQRQWFWLSVFISALALATSGTLLWLNHLS